MLHLIGPWPRSSSSNYKKKKNKPFYAGFQLKLTLFPKDGGSVVLFDYYFRKIPDSNETLGIKSLGENII